VVEEIVQAHHRIEAHERTGVEFEPPALLHGIDPGELPRLCTSLANDISVKRRLVDRVEAPMTKTGDTASSMLKKVAG
jgi:hypothetical protein